MRSRHFRRSPALPRCQQRFVRHTAARLTLRTVSEYAPALASAADGLAPKRSYSFSTPMLAADIDALPAIISRSWPLNVCVGLGCASYHALLGLVHFS
jgi:hypothetical protein